MRPAHRIAAALLATLAGAAAGAACAAPAAAHPLGNFSVNHYHGLRLYPDRLDDTAVLDEAEIPTLQNRTRVDRDADGSITPDERAAFATTTCGQIAADLHTEVNGQVVTWAIAASDYTNHPGQGGLSTGRTECRLTAPTDLRRAATITITDSHRTDRLGWREITAAGAGVTLASPPVAAKSVSDELRRYPKDVLSAPLDERSIQLHTTPGGGTQPSAAAPAIPIAGPVNRAVGALTDRFNALAASPRLTPLIGLLATCLALLLGAAHAALPGHGKTVMAAYIAGKRGSTRDAVIVGVTVTATHTGGVLALGLALTLAAGLAGEALLGWLGVASGVLIAGIGAGLLRSTRSARRRHHPGPAVPAPLLRPTAAGTPAARVGAGGSGQAMAEPGRPDRAGDHDHHHGRRHGGHLHDHGHDDQGPIGRRGLVGIGIAGGLVPSPSALIVLLGAIALGRTWFGVLLVIAYGAGMAATLTAAGLLLVHLRNRLETTHRGGRWSRAWAAAGPVVTASLVLVVGLGLAIRSALPLLGA